MPLSCPVGPAFQRELHKDGGGGGGGVARRARAARAPKAKSCATSCGTSITVPVLYVPVFHVLVFHVPVLHVLVFHVLVLHVSLKGRRGRRHSCFGRGFEGRLGRGLGFIRGRARVRVAACRSIPFFFAP